MRWMVSRPEHDRATTAIAVVARQCVSSSEGVMLSGILDRDPTQIGEFGDCRLAAETAVTAALDAAERHLRLVVHGRAIDMADAGFDACGNRHRPLDVAAEDRGRQAVFGV